MNGNNGFSTKSTKDTKDTKTKSLGRRQTQTDNDVN